MLEQISNYSKTIINKSNIAKAISWLILATQLQVSNAIEVHTSSRFIDEQIGRLDRDSWDMDELREYVEKHSLDSNIRFLWGHMNIDNLIWWYADWRYDLESYWINEVEPNYYNVRLKFVKDRRLPIPHYENIQVYNKWRYLVIKHWRNIVKTRFSSGSKKVKIWDMYLELELTDFKRRKSRKHHRRHHW